MKNGQVAYIGVDVSKGSLSVDAGECYVGKVANAAADIRRLIRELKRKIGRDKIPHVCFESTGPYGELLFTELCAAGVAASVLNPAKVRHYAKAMSESAKTDPIDARIIRLFAEDKKPAPTRVPGGAERALRQLILVRDSLTKSAVQLSGVKDSVSDAFAARALQKAIDGLKDRIKKVDGRIAKTLEGDKRLAGLVSELSLISGIGGLTATKMVALVPELGTLGRRASASLAGLAPFARDSGKLKGKAFVCGGRASVRRALFMPAAVAIRHNPVLKSAYENLRKKGKPYKVALTAVMRKLFFYMDRVAAKWYEAQGGGNGVTAPQNGLA